MINFERIPKTYIAVGSTDLRKGMDGYAALIQNNFHCSPFEDALFMFCNRQRDKIKILYWDKTGFWLFYKRLEKGKFKWPKEEAQLQEITQQQLRWLLEGLNIEQKRAHKESIIKYV